MKSLIKLLILIVVLEIILGYALYLRDSPKMTGNYISSTLHVLDKLTHKFGEEKRRLEEADEKRKLEEVEKRRLEEEEKQLRIEEAERVLLMDLEEKRRQEEEEKRKLEEVEKRRLEEEEKQRRIEEANCEEYIDLNRVLTIADMRYHRGSVKLQTSIDNLNTSDFSNKYIIVIAGNSEAYGDDQKIQKRLHFRLEEKLKNKFKSDNIIVFNLSDFGFFLNDQLHSIQNFSKIFNPDLVIFYTGGNEMYLHRYYEDMVINNISLNFDNEYWYEFSEDNEIYQKCLNKKIFLTQFNFHKKHDSLDVSRYINNGFLKIKKYFSNIDSDFIFYIHPLNTEKVGQALLQEFQDIKIPDKRFFNLSNEDFNLEFHDEFHTLDSNIMANKILEDIVLKHEQKIINKINISSK